MLVPAGCMFSRRIIREGALAATYHSHLLLSSCLAHRGNHHLRGFVCVCSTQTRASAEHEVQRALAGARVRICTGLNTKNT